MNNSHNAKYAFYYLLSLAALIFVAISTGMILFSIINKTIPDALNMSGNNFDGALKFAISALLIATPIFFILMNLIGRGFRKEEITKDSALRRWLTYFNILVSSLIILGVFIGVINNFLSGDLTSQFILKALTVFVIAAVVFSFYFYDIRRTDLVKKDKIVKIFFWASLVIVIAVFISAWFFVESPKTARARRLDQIVVNNIYSLESSVNNYYEKYKKLPDELMTLKADTSIYTDPNAFFDPETKTPITYEKLSDDTFKFCALFRTDSNIDAQGRPMAVYPSGGDSKAHAAGFQCLNGTLWAKVNAVPATIVK
jgi:amino acid transporter